MEAKAIGGQWLKERLNLVNYTMTHASYIAGSPNIRLTSKGNIEQDFTPRYAITTPDALLHLEFYLKYDDFSLDFLYAVFQRIAPTEIEAFIEATPTSKYARSIGFLFEFLTGKELMISRTALGNYVDLLDPEKYITGQTVKVVRWRINNNLPGTVGYCPIVRKTPELRELLKYDLSAKIENLKKEYPEEIFRRATNYLYTKETRSSYEIEKEKPSEERTQKFVTLLQMAGRESNNEILQKKRLIALQNAIIDPRFAASDFRDFQNYVGVTMSNFRNHIHYVCPPPAITASLMEGLEQMVLKTAGKMGVIRAALISFGFVLIHPFEDGNGRIHRFLIHDVLSHDKIVPQDLIIPVSAHMLNNLKEYDISLEKYSKPLMQRVKYTSTEDGELTITNPDEVEGYFRFPDLTEQCIYLINTIHATVMEDMPKELSFLQRFDEAKLALQKIVDMPDKMITQMLTFLHQNNGLLPKRRRDIFGKLTDEEIQQMQSAYRKIYEIDDY